MKTNTDPISLRWYQEEADKAYYDYLCARKTGDPVIELPTGSGKGYVIAAMLKRYAGQFNAQMLVLADRHTLITQNYEKACRYWPEGKELFGINSAGLNRRDTGKPVIFGGIQSMARHAGAFGKRNIVIIDEAHKVRVEDAGQYREFIRSLRAVHPQMRAVGLTAWPSRMDSGPICGTGEEYLFERVICRALIKDLLEEGWLCRPVTPAVENQMNTEGVETTSGGEFVNEQLDRRFNDEELIRRQVAEMAAKGKNRRAWLVYCINIEHSERVAWEMERQKIETALIHSEISGDERTLLKEFKAEKHQALVNVNMFVEGFDDERIDLIGGLSPTASTGRYYQRVGRGMRTWEDLERGLTKEDCLYLDFAGDVGFHGPIDQLQMTAHSRKTDARAPRKLCGSCGMRCHNSRKVCPYCGQEFPKAPWTNRTIAKFSTGAVISGPQWLDVSRAKPVYDKEQDRIIVHYYCDEGRKVTVPVTMDNDAWFDGHLGDDRPFDAENFFNAAYALKMKTPARILVDGAGALSKVEEYSFAS